MIHKLCVLTNGVCLCNVSLERENFMKAVGYKESLPIENPSALLDIELPVLRPENRDLLVEIRAISVNPVDVKVRMRAQPQKEVYKVLGWDAAGIVKEAGPEATLFKPGDEVYYAGSIARQGTNSEFHVVDERIVGRKPKSLDFSHAAALPLTTITAWELLFDRFGVPHGDKIDRRALLVIGGAGGVGSILIQLARKLTGLTVIATASRPETQAWCIDLGAHHVIDHGKPFAEQLSSIGNPQVNYIASLTATDTHYPAVIDNPKTLDALPLKQKAASLHWEFMFTRSLFNTPDILKQHNLLNQVADLVDTEIGRSTTGNEFGTINATNLKRAHALIESGRSRGKIVLAGF